MSGGKKNRKSVLRLYMGIWVGDEMRSLFNLCNYVCLKISLSFSHCQLPPSAIVYCFRSVDAYVFVSLSTANGYH